jgi:hypothetical protein
MKTPVDVETKFAFYQIKNRNMGGTAIYDALKYLENATGDKARYVIFKPKRGEWLVVESLSQHQQHHGDNFEVSNGEE